MNVDVRRKIEDLHYDEAELLDKIYPMLFPVSWVFFIILCPYNLQAENVQMGMYRDLLEPAIYVESTVLRLICQR